MKLTKFLLRPLIAVILISLCAGRGFAASGKFDIFSFSGPKMKELYYITITDPDAAILAMSSGKLDVLGDVFRPSDIERLSSMNEVTLSLAPSFHEFLITLNVRKFPWDHKELRQAASQVVDRKRWVRDLFSGYCESITGFLPSISPYYEATEPFPYGTERARRRLADAGWTRNSSGWLVAPDGRPLPVTKILCPPSSVAATTTEIAQLFAEALVSIGIPAEINPMDFQTMIARIQAQDFDVSTSAWTLSRDPDTLFSFYHSSMNVDGGYNNSGISDPELDAALSELRYAPDEKSARAAASRAQALLSDLMPVIPLYSRYSISAMRNDWRGAFSTDRITSDNSFSLISMTPQSGEARPIYWSLPSDIRTLNPLVSTSAYDWMVLGTVYDGSLISVDPYTFEDAPWLARSWEIGTDKSSGREKTVMSFTLRDGLKWQDGRPLTVEDAAFTLNYIKKNEVPRFYDIVHDIESITTDAKRRTIRIVMANTSYWHLHNIGGMFVLPKHILEKVPDWRAWQPANRRHKAADGTDMTELVGTGPFIFEESRTGEYVRMKRNDRYILYRGGAK
ncbi:hypothetical protein FACS1894216_03830 [Synergistales bacterium]|nr:hypothetical protein FACS1894216_03830 [Synergistales bacterium]